MARIYINYSFEKKVSGFLCTCKGNNGYYLDDYEDVDGMISDVAKLLKERDAMVDFIDGPCIESSRDFLRLYRSWDGTIAMVTWRYNNGRANETITEEKLKNTRGTVKKYVLEAIRLFNETREAA